MVTFYLLLAAQVMANITGISTDNKYYTVGFQMLITFFEMVFR